MSAQSFGRIPVTILDAVLDRCQNTYGVAPCTATGAPGTECYNTFRTCQDRANFVKGSHTYRFCERGNPVPNDVAAIWPYIERISAASTVIDLGKGLAARAKITVAMTDAPDTDHEQDPYSANRASPAGGTFLTRLIARNHNLAGRLAKVRRGYVRSSGYVDPGYVLSGYIETGPRLYYSAEASTFDEELYVIDGVNGPDRGGKVSLILKDPLKLADRVQVPTPTKGELIAPITATALSLTLKSGQGAEYGSSGWVRFGEEIIRFTSRSGDTLSWPDTSYRAQFGTVAAVHNANSRGQLCKVWQSATVAAVLIELLGFAGIASSYIDSSGITAEAETWLSHWTIRDVCLSEPEDVAKLLEEIVQIAVGVLWWSPLDQKVRFKPMRPLSPFDAAPVALNDEAGFVRGSLDIDRQEAKRLTRCIVYYAIKSPTAKRDDPVNYLRGYGVVDTDAEGPNEHDDVREKVIYARLLTEANDATAEEYAVRTLLIYRAAPVLVRGKVDPKEIDLAVGEIADLTAERLVDFDGNSETLRTLVLRRDENGLDVTTEFVSTFADGRWAYIAPDAAPDYSAATEPERRYGYICDDTGVMPDKTEGYAIV